MRFVTGADSLFTDFSSRPESVTERLAALSEPWRGNFLRYIAERVGRDGQAPSLEEVREWLAADPVLCRHVRLLLYEWTKR